MAGEVLGRAYIEVHADTAPFNQQLPADVERAARSVTPQARQAGSRMGREFVRGARDSVRRNGPSFFAEIRKIFQTEGRRGTFAQAYGRVLGASIRAGMRRSLIGRIGHDLADIFRREVRSGSNAIFGSARMIGSGLLSIFTNTAESIGNVFSGIFGGGGGGGRGRGRGGGILRSIGSSFGNVGSSGPLAGIVGVLIAVGIPALIGLVLSLVSELGALINVIGFLPGAFAVAGAAITPLIVGFQGFGEALGAVMENDPEKLAEALKNLTPSARALVLELKDLMPLFSQARKAIQESLFSKLTGGQLTATVKTAAPTFQQGGAQVAASWGTFISQLMALVREPATKTFFENLFSSTATVLDRLGPGFLDTLRGLMRIADQTLPRIEGIATTWGGMLSTFGDWLIEQADNGNLDEFLDNFNEALDSLMDLAGSGYHLLESMLEGVDVGGASGLFDGIVEMIDTLTRFFKSDVGKQSLEGMVTLAKMFLVVIGLIVLAWAGVVALIQDAYEFILKILHALGLVDTHPATKVAGFNSADARRAMRRTVSAHAEGTITTGPELALIGERGPEAVIPLTDPGRARQIMAQSGLDTLSDSGGTNVYVYLGNDQLEPYMVRVQRKGAKQMARDLRAGPRSLGVAG